MESVVGMEVEVEAMVELLVEEQLLLLKDQLVRVILVLVRRDR